MTPTYPFAVPTGVDIYPVASGKSNLGTVSNTFDNIYINSINSNKPSYAFLYCSGLFTGKQQPGTATTYAIVSGLNYVTAISSNNFILDTSTSAHRITYIGSSPIIAHALGTVGMFWNVNSIFRLAICKNGDYNIGDAIADVYSNGAVGDMNWSVQAILPMVSGDYLQLGTRSNAGGTAQGGNSFQFTVTKLI